MLEELRRRNHAESTIHAYLHTVEHLSRYFHQIFSSSSRSAWPGAYPPVSGRIVHAVESGPEHRDAAVGSLTFLLCPGIEERMELCRDAVSEEDSALAAGAEPGRSGASDRRGGVSPFIASCG